MSSAAQDRSGVLKRLTDKTIKIDSPTDNIPESGEELENESTNFLHLAGQFTGKFKTPVSHSEEKIDLEMAKAHTAFIKAKTAHHLNVESSSLLHSYEEALRRITILTNQKHTKPAELDIESEQKYITQLRVDLAFVKGKKWEYFTRQLTEIHSRIHREESERSQLINELRKIVANAEKYCEIKNKYKLFKDSKNYTKYLAELVPYKNLISPPSVPAPAVPKPTIVAVTTPSSPKKFLPSISAADMHFTAEDAKESDIDTQLAIAEIALRKDIVKHDSKIESVNHKIREIKKIAKKKIDEVKSETSDLEKLEKAANALEAEALKFRKPEPEPESCCCSCWTAFFRRKKKDTEDYRYQPLPSSPKSRRK